MRNMKAQILASRKRRADRRTRNDIKHDIMRAISNDNTLKRTNIANRCNINYTVAVDYTDEMMMIDKTISRDEKGVFSLTDMGRDEICEKEMGKAAITKIVKIAMEFAATDVIEFTTMNGGTCKVCGNRVVRGKGHNEMCAWARLRQISKTLGK
jgi:predicted transcriptional regulator